MTKPLWEQLSTQADSISSVGINLNTVKVMRAASIQMQNWYEGCQEYREDAERLAKENADLRASMRVIILASRELANYVELEEFTTPADCFSKDLAPWRNIVAATYPKEKKPRGNRNAQS